ncbi:ankyrin repeat domain-containing protein [Fluoribacter dumoffii]|uniref:Ribulose-5-phosphate 4-epimerase and related epimerases and aldolases n=1 Tax=Fluoribacter dumoffii TaxID=463 RepID=A0A377GE46_9GAMM|nr:ankyrin repeat domain-containing protein [Fluoribacter dumoffii]KTC91360.1 Ankyrin repeat protein [Fluoribacter dumoffii NY 23]MCW8416980.1 ankyrin repeat domain-containing protein [Fluoribacter dumoffii]MCW8455180.1 ankyrin repeat domain-containing protein [Fluoribacter dumoffii]MCW8460743.1 ankyrin repeat domain-containing protein [Fluoribacter dumoffii]STO23062.1 Ribulose-5-phosphate 4-epimerase and related epimerases and aldolases [Fluoribacter dumoffii]
MKAKTQILPFKSKKNPLFTAAKEGARDRVEELLTAGADIDTGRPHRSNPKLNESPLYAAAKNGHVEVVKILLNHRPRPKLVFRDSSSHQALTPLLIAAKEGNDKVMQELLKDERMLRYINTGGPEGSPLFHAFNNKHFAIARLLMAHGASIERARAGDTTILDLAVEFAISEQKNDWLDLLLQSNNPVDRAKRREHICLALKAAVRKGNSSLVEHLGTNYGAEVKSILPSDPTPLFIAIRNQDHAMAKLLLNKGADGHLRSHLGFQALSSAILNNDSKMFELLLNQAKDHLRKDDMCKLLEEVVVYTDTLDFIQPLLEEAQPSHLSKAIHQAIALNKPEITDALLKNYISKINFKEFNFKFDALPVLVEKGHIPGKKTDFIRCNLTQKNYPLPGRDALYKILTENALDIYIKETAERVQRNSGKNKDEQALYLRSYNIFGLFSLKFGSPADKKLAAASALKRFIEDGNTDLTPFAKELTNGRLKIIYDNLREFHNLDNKPGIQASRS